ncbi:hypothetical protein K457DRAFT_411663 [Linnemannia elongata AG-77]|uniref:Uncharacterized protein n=1 Tax=Linnemannia elongata AG-77 TaxID=1314771 RepID=A0A197K074_9FUNG|nr:hypothetical protein K457DRAFT_411663 [Linnemannia elongata AG-77]
MWSLYHRQQLINKRASLCSVKKKKKKRKKEIETKWKGNSNDVDIIFCLHPGFASCRRGKKRVKKLSMHLGQALRQKRGDEMYERRRNERMEGRKESEGELFFVKREIERERDRERR